MQLRESSFHGPRPACPEHPKQRVHRHGFYARFENCDSQQRLRIERFVCPRCGRTLSVLPKNRLSFVITLEPTLETTVQRAVEAINRFEFMKAPVLLMPMISPVEEHI